jgi:thiamine biosynthesis lipoprotein
MSEHDVIFDAMGSHVRLLIGEAGPGALPPPAAAERARRFIVQFEQALSRFRPHSELCALNEDSRGEVPASGLLREAVKAGLWAAQRSDGLVDPTLMHEIESAGYRASRAGVPSAPLGAALEEAPPRHPAAAHPAARWRQIRVDDGAGTITRPPGVAFDTGGAGKGLAADLLARQLRGHERFLVDCGGDIRIGGSAAAAWPYEVHVEHPLTGERAFVLQLGSGGVATSGINVRIWRGSDGRYAHHLLDPATGEPAWTGLIGVTALGESALEAETLSKAALLAGPEGARELLADRGGLLVHDSARVELVGRLNVQPRIKLPASFDNQAEVAA